MIEKLKEDPLYDPSGEFIIGTVSPDRRTIMNKVNEIIDIINGGEE